jgi:hypothetical protein
MLCGYPTALLDRKTIAMIAIDRFEAYADESEQVDTEQSPYLIAAYVLPASQWLGFADEWHDCCVNRQPKIKFFHAIEAEGLYGEFLGVAPEFRNAKVRDLAAIIRKRHLMNIQCWVSRRDYQSIVAGNVPPELDDPYYLLWEKLTGLMVMTGIHFGSSSPVDFIFDEKKHMEQRVLDAYFQIVKYAKPPVSELLGNTPRFESDERVIPLQAADMLAWNLRRAISYPSEQRPIPDILELIQPGMAAELHINREQLEDFVEIER